MSPIRRRIKVGGHYLGEDLPAGWLNPWGNVGENIGVLEPLGQGEVGADGSTTRNIGAGLWLGRAWPSTVLPFTGLPSGITYNSSNKRFTVSSIVEDVIFPGFVTLTSTGKIINCVVQGPPAELTGGYLDMIEGPATGTPGEMWWCTIAPNVESAYYDGVGRGVTGYYCDIYDVVDGGRLISSAIGTTARITLFACDLHHSTQFRPDYAYSGGRPETHCDVGGQMQGNGGAVDEYDIRYYGCRVNARHSLTKGTIPATRTQISALMMTPVSSRGPAKMTFESGWLYGGMYCVNAGSDGVNAYGPSKLRITNTKFERPGTDMFGDGRAPDKAFVCDPSLDVVHFGNTYVNTSIAVPKENG